VRGYGIPRARKGRNNREGREGKGRKETLGRQRKDALVTRLLTKS